MSALIWVLNLAVALLAAVNAVAWGYATREVGDPQLSLSFLLRLVFNKWFILAMATAFTAALLSYAVLRKMGVLAGRFFLTLQLVAVILASLLVLKEQPSAKTWIGIILVMAGVIVIGYGE
ncbi:MAG: EamA family transporter [Candidatus Nezhaarchaeales archaeon]